MVLQTIVATATHRDVSDHDVSTNDSILIVYVRSPTCNLDRIAGSIAGEQAK